MKKLTKAEEQVMQILWDLEEGLVKDVIKEFPDPKPAYNTVSTVIRVLEKKDFIEHKAYGTTYVYFPKVGKEEYAKIHFMDFMKDYFNDSFPQMATFFAREKNMSIHEMEEILKLTEEEIKKNQSEDNE